MIRCILFLVLVSTGAFAEKTLVYDEEKGIIFVDKNAKELKPEKYSPAKENPRVVDPVIKKSQAPTGLEKATGPKDIHTNRIKDPPDLYFKSGLEYYKNEDYLNALKNFKYAAEHANNAEYVLWLGKTFRQLDTQLDIDKRSHFFNLMERILTEFPESDVADDALFEMAFYYQKENDYDNAIKLYKKLIEQYPFGSSYSSGDEFLDIARTQMQMMRGEIISSLKLLGITTTTIEDGCRQFQQKNNLKITAAADLETIKAIKARYSEKLLADEQQTSLRQWNRKSSQWGLVLGLVLFVSCFAAIVMRMKIAQNRAQVLTLMDMVSDLNLDRKNI